MKVFRFIQILIFGNLLFLCYLQAGSDLDKGIQYIEQGEFEVAKEFFLEKVKENKDDAAANHYLGRTYLLLRNHDKAIEYLERAIELNSNIADYHFWLGQALGIKAQNSNIIKQAFIAPKILKEFEKTIELDSTHIGGHVGAANFYIQAPSIMGGDMGKARKEAEILLTLNEMQGKLILIAIYEKENRPDLAEQAYEEYEKSLDDSTGNYQFYNSYGYFLLKQKKYNKAIKIFQKQVRLAPDKANPHDSLGDSYRAAGRLEEALSEYQKAVEIDATFKPSLKKIKELKAEIRKNKNEDS